MDLLLGLISLIILIYSAILHEIAHGFVAERLGDPTARLMGRLTLNPKNHIDPIMSIALPLILILSGSPVIFGAAKPVPVDPFNFREPKKDMALVSLAGPGTNLLIAVTFALICRLLFPSLSLDVIRSTGLLGFILGTVVYINILLAIFNLIPIPPLDGSKIFALILPDKEAAVYLSIGSIGIFIIFFLLLFPIGGLSLGSLISNLLNFSLRLLGL
ncbi:MAG TPA: site-2 protease family protein [Patescibacteria group bacterium]|jgi:Zn-dependent protease|nr:site-2 protease family protein [Patescibacteria group bacterium]